jgi:hypothetical protein
MVKAKLIFGLAVAFATLVALAPVAAEARGVLINGTG